MAGSMNIDPVIKIEEDEIPLRCYVCPKQPTFSDVSHLLTHISSKSHLSHMFQLRIRSQQEQSQDARDMLGRYDDWFAQYGIGSLLADRLAAKDQKKANKHGRSSLPTNTAAVSARQHNIKREPGDSTNNSYQLPRMTAWNPTNSIDHMGANDGQQGYGYGSLIYNTPSARARKGNEISQYPDSPERYNLRMPLQSPRSETETTDSILPSEVATDMTETGGDMSKLKGLIWPGMDLFDSATPEMKRKRNQRKDSSVLENMKSTSAAVEPTEMVWSSEGDLQRSRYIYDSPSIDGSPDEKKDITDKAKKRKPRQSVTTGVGRNTRSRASTMKAGTGVTKSSSAVVDNGLVTEYAGGEAEEADTLMPINHGHNLHNSYDVFSDSPYVKSGRNDSLFADKRYELPRRHILQTMSANASIASPSPAPGHRQLSFPYFDTDNNPVLAWQSRSTFYPPPGPFVAEGVNPLCVTDSGFPYKSYRPHGFEEPNGTIREACMMNRNPMRSALLETNRNPYDPKPAHRGTDEFDI